MFEERMNGRPELLFHSPCFDGIASAVIALDFLQQCDGWSAVDLQHVNYSVRDSWLSRRFDRPTAVVDFLYHPEADFWADHHVTSFLSPEARCHFEQRHDRRAIYDRNADSCAGLLWRRLAAYAGYRNDRFTELVRWAEKIDAARYDSIDEAFSFDSPAIRISYSLAFSNDSYCESLVRVLTAQSLAEASALPDVVEKFERVRELSDEGLRRFKAGVELRDGIAVFIVDARDVMVSRYAPYRFYPHARYSVGAVRTASGVKITAMRNPWLSFESAPLGEIFRDLGGGGHQRVASAIVGDRSDEEVRHMLDEIVAAIERTTPLANTLAQ